MENTFTAIKATVKEMYANNPIMAVIMGIVAIIALPVVLDIVFCIGNFILNIAIFAVGVIAIVYGVSYLKEKTKG